MSEAVQPPGASDPAGQLEQLWQQGLRPDVSAFLAALGPPSPAGLVSVLCMDQRQRWRRGERIPAEDYLRRYPQLSADPEAALDLVFHEYLLRERGGERPDAGEYLRRFPQHAVTLAQQIQLHLAVVGDAGATATCPAVKAAVPGLPVVPGYEVLEELGRGGMGVVFKALHLKLNRVVALKTLLSAGQADEQERARFRTEALSVARLQHPNVVQIYEVGEHAGRPYLALEFCPGGSLAGRLDGTPWPARQAAELVETLARAVHAAHQAGVVHRDLKPANVLLVGADLPVCPGEKDRQECLPPRVKITDFGLAKRLDADASLTASGAIVGTPSYMAPEQAAGRKDVGPAADVYALAALLYELLTGRPPFRAATALDTLRQVLEAEPAPPRLLNPAVPRDLETVVLKGLRKRPAQRYGSAEAHADDLRAFLDGRPVSARRPGPLERAGRWIATHRLGSGAAAVLAVLLLVFALVLRREVAAVEFAQVSIAVALNQEGPIELPLVGQLLHARRDEPLGPPFSVPTVSPLRVPAGPCRLRLTRAGALSGTYWLGVRPRTTGIQRWTVVAGTPADPGYRLVFPNLSDSVKANTFPPPHNPRQLLWPGPLEGAAWYETTAAAKGRTVIVSATSNTKEAWIPGQELRGHAGADGKVLWKHSLGGNGPLAKISRSYFGSSDLASRCRLVTGPALVLGSQWTGTLVAVSTGTGEVLWTRPGTPLRGVPQEQGTGAVLSLGPRPPATLDVNGDGVPDLVAVVLPAREAPNVVLQALCGRTGRVLWRHELPRDRGAVRGFAFAPTPALIRSAGRPVIALVCNGRLVGIDAATGRPAWPARALAFQPVHPPRFADLDGDGEEEALLLQEDEEGLLTLTVLAPARGSVVWEQSWPGVSEPLRLRGNVPPPEHDPDWPLVADLDGRPTVVVRAAVFPPGQAPDRSGEWKTRRDPLVESVQLLALDGASGAVRWRRQLARSCSERIRCTATLRLLVGPDGVLYVASLLAPWRAELYDRPVELYVDALSGADGRSLWTWRHPLGPPRTGLHDTGQDLSSGKGLEPLRWWPAAGGDAPLLVVPLDAASFDPEQETQRRAAFVLAARTGRFCHLVPWFRVVEVTDLDGDGRPELVGWKDPFGTAPSWQALHGTAPAVLEQAQQWKPARYVVVHINGGGARPEVEPSPVQEPDPPGDPRGLVPLPWARSWMTRSWQDELFLEDWLSKMVLVVFPVCVAAYVGGRLAQLRKRERLRAQGLSEADLRQRERRSLCQFIALWLLALALTIGVGAVLLLRDAGTLAPGECYQWPRWYVQAGMSWGLAFLVLSLLWGAILLARRVVRRFRGRGATSGRSS